jgi:hypothetical protein
MAEHVKDWTHALEPAFATSGTGDWLFGFKEWLRRIFQCWHRDLSRPFTIEGETYRVCLHCGARRRFIAESWRTVGDFYHNSDHKALQRRNPRWQRATQKEHAAYRPQSPVESSPSGLKQTA